MCLSKIENKWSLLRFKFITNNTDNKWKTISHNLNLTMEMINDNLDKTWDWYWISYNPNLTMEMIKNNLNKPWDWQWISANPNITMDIINDNPDKPWNWNGISFNPNLTIEMINNNLNKKWNWNEIAGNDMKNDKKDYVNQLTKMLLLVKLYNYYDTTVTYGRNDAEIIFYDIFLVKQIINF